MDAGSPVEGIHLQPRVIRSNKTMRTSVRGEIILRQTAQPLRERDGLLRCIAGKAVCGLRQLGRIGKVRKCFYLKDIP